MWTVICTTWKKYKDHLRFAPEKRAYWPISDSRGFRIQNVQAIPDENVIHMWILWINRTDCISIVASIVFSDWPIVKLNSNRIQIETTMKVIKAFFNDFCLVLKVLIHRSTLVNFSSRLIESAKFASVHGAQQNIVSLTNHIASLHLLSWLVISLLFDNFNCFAKFHAISSHIANR